MAALLCKVATVPTNTQITQLILWKTQVDSAVARVEPARRDGLAAGIEVNALNTVRFCVAEERVLETTKRVVSNRHRDRNVDADHSDLDFILKASSGSTVIRKYRRSIPKR